ncbi:MAG: rhomboid family intramembrane serine protease [Verrucomicrobiota bacterium JB023]|nr:rhomboid family intramembrane serine protease [Verrucomicrobiota bacterium JB023]
MFLPFWLTGGNGGPLTQLYEVFGLSRQGFIREHRYWQLVTHSLLHGNFLHWMTNAWILYYFGGRIRHLFGEGQVARIAISSLIFGGIFHLLFQGKTPLVGASGIAIGLFVALCTVSPESRMAPLPVSAKNLRNGFLIASLLLLMLRPELRIPGFHQFGQYLIDTGGSSLFQMGHACHLGGALAGWLSVRKYLRRPITLAQLQRERAKREEDEKRVA